MIVEWLGRPRDRRSSRGPADDDPQPPPVPRHLAPGRPRPARAAGPGGRGPGRAGAAPPRPLAGRPLPRPAPPFHIRVLPLVRRAARICALGFLGAYDVRAKAVLEPQARWIADAGVGAIALSWWGRGSDQDANVPYVMDVMKDHDVKVTFALEPYADYRGQRYASDILYLIEQYGDKRGWDAFLVLKNEDGSEGPVFKGFRCILPRESTDCHGVTRPVDDYTPDAVWRAQTDGLRDALRRDFDHVTLLADSLEFARTPASGFDGIGIYDNNVGPETYAGYAAGASRAGLLFSFNVNPGFDSIVPRTIPDCYAPPAFVPAAAGLDFARADDRERAAQLSQQRIVDSFAGTVQVQTDPALTNARRGFFLVYINSFNEWHEGHAFEPMKDAADLTPAERSLGYHNPARGDYRLATLGRLVQGVLAGGGGSFDRRPRRGLSWPA
ncbi:MAG: hypothetical protein DMF80_23575 [Acidobacteria bacterium]|nr:MAG: hypothetical protein DMF80_23575 [Acidobacteriota bacterium]